MTPPFRAESAPRRVPVGTRHDASSSSTPRPAAGIWHGLFVLSFLTLLSLLAFGFYRDGALAALGETFGSPIHRYLHTAGVHVQKIVVTGQVRLGDEAILGALGIRMGQSLFGFDAQAAQQRLAQLDLVKSARVMRLLPATLLVELEERVAFARWLNANAISLIDREGIVLPQKEPVDGSQLPLVAGAGAARQAEAIIRLLTRHEPLAELIAMAQLVDGSRWNLVGKSGALVKLPAGDAGLALARFVAMDDWRDLLQTGDVVIDLRLADRAFVRRLDRSARKAATAG